MSDTDKKYAAAALYGFAGWLTTLDNPVTLSAYNDASIAAELVSEYCDANGLGEPGDMIQTQVHPTTRPVYSEE